jgi:two-component system OmpR family response regulator
MIRHRSIVLLVDDDPSVRQSLARALTFENFDVLVAANSDEALRGFAENPIDVLLLDQDLGRESGWDTLEQLRNRKPGLPVIMMTARPEQRTVRSTQGVEALMKKPLDLPLLFEILDALAVQTHEKRLLSGTPPRRAD